MVFQNYALYPHMTVGENMGFALKIAEAQGARCRSVVAAAASCCDLTDYLDRKPGSSRAGSASASPWAGRSCAAAGLSAWTSPCRISTRKLRVQTRTQIAAAAASG